MKPPNKSFGGLSKDSALCFLAESRREEKKSPPLLKLLCNESFAA